MGEEFVACEEGEEIEEIEKEEGEEIEEEEMRYEDRGKETGDAS